MITEPGHYKRLYTLDDLIRLRECLKCNSWRISSALTAFGSYDRHWMEFAERIKEDDSFPEKHFTSNHVSRFELE